MKNIFLLADNHAEAKKLANILESYSSEIQISTAANITQADMLLSKEVHFDVFFIDISQSDSRDAPHGLKWAKKLLHHIPHYSQPPICFITTSPDYIYQAVNEIHCFSYILKPYKKQDIFCQLDALFRNKQQSILLKTLDNIFISFCFSDLVFIHSNGRYLDFYIIDSTYRSRQYTMKRLMQILPREFALCHKSYIINQLFVENYDFVNHYVHMKGHNDDIPLSRNFHL